MKNVFSLVDDASKGDRMHENVGATQATVRKTYTNTSFYTNPQFER